MTQLFAVILGLSFGSFINVIIYRLPREIFLSKKRSFCPHCAVPIPFYRNIPVISFILQKGLCAECKQPISVQYIIVEVLSGFLFWWAVTNYSLPESILFIWISSNLLAIAFIDQKTFIIPYEMVLGSIIGLVIYYFLYPEQDIPSLMGLVMGVGYMGSVFLVTSLISGKQTLGYGDLQLIAVTGLWIGPINVLISIFFSALCTLIVWSRLSITDGFNRNRPLPFAPYLVAFAIILYMLNLDLYAFLNSN
jgi:leader peptidase (prepilin peptidase)/N-methyltransferase